MPIRTYTLTILCFVLGGTVTRTFAQTSKVSGKEPIASAPNSKDPELDHMAALITTIKGEIPSIQDPAAKKTASDNLDLWQHLFDRLLLENKKANSTGEAHHHKLSAPDPALKQSPKP